MRKQRFNDADRNRGWPALLRYQARHSDGAVDGKPAVSTDVTHARKMLTLLAGTTHLVITGVCVAKASANFLKSSRSMSAVKMRFLTPGELDRYLAGGEWQNKAGGYGIQGHAAVFVEELRGSYSGVVGLPLFETAALLARAGLGFWLTARAYHL